jgi:SPP1 gp7 family putative phage head morphogenesis protein
MLALPSGFEQLDEIRANEADQTQAEQLVELQAEVYAEEVPLWEKDLVGFFNDQRGRVLRDLGKFTTGSESKRSKSKKPKKELAPERVWQELRENDALRSVWEARGQGVAQRTVERIAEILGLSVADTRLLIDELATRVVGINKTTREKLAKEIALGISRGYSVTQIANGVPEENYRGVAGVFDEATTSRALTIARTETTTVYNAASLEAYAQSGAARVEVFDGIRNDDECRQANGQVWPIDEARRKLTAHPNCVRSFAPIFAGTGRSEE